MGLGRVRIHYGGGAACATIHHAAMAVASGQAEVVVCYRAFNERSENRYGSGAPVDLSAPTSEPVHLGWYIPQGLLTAAGFTAAAATAGMGSKWQPIEVGVAATQRATAACAHLDTAGLLESLLG